MKISAAQIGQVLSKGLAPVYLIAGEEPLQYMEVVDAICETATADGYTERQVFHVETGFDWNSLLVEAASMSLFAEKKLLDVRLPSAKPGREGGAALREYASNPPPDTILLLRVGRFDKGGANTAWVKALDAAGVFVQIWDLKPQDTFRWVENRLKRAGFQPEQDAVRLLTARIEGNLLAAAQEIEKLRMVLDPGPLSLKQVREAVTDSSRFDIFELSDAALAAQPERAARILEALRGEGLEPPQILWALARDIRMLAQLSDAAAKGKNSKGVLGNTWQQRVKQLSGAVRRYSNTEWSEMLQRCVLVDEIIKGVRKGNAWNELLQLTLWFAGKPMWRAGAGRSMQR